MTGRRARGARAIVVPLVAVGLVAVTGSGGAAAAGPCDAIVQRGNALQKLFQGFTQQAYSDGVITPQELAQSDIYYNAVGKNTAALSTCITTGTPPPGYLNTPLAKAKPAPKKPRGKLSPKAKSKGRRGAALHAFKLAKKTPGLAKQGRTAQKGWSASQTGKSEKSFGDWLVDVKDFFDKKDKLKEEYEKYFGKKEPKKFDLSKYEAPAAGLRKAQALQLPQYTQQLEKLGDFRNVASRAAVTAEGRDPEVKKQLDLAAGLYKGDYNATFDSLTPKERGDVATQASVMIQTGAAARLVEEMNAAGKAATNVVYAH
jgi:hypothetical protein